MSRCEHMSDSLHEAEDDQLKEDLKQEDTVHEDVVGGVLK